jgi:RNA polymerase-binding transcription factor DksA
MPKVEQAWALARLEEERLTTLDRLEGLQRDFRRLLDASAGSNADDEHDPEGATIAFERSQLDALIQQAECHLDDIADARRRLSDGRFGLCQSCDQPIARARLEARPVARTCVGCGSALRH